MVQPLWKTVWWFLRKLNVELPHDPAIPLLVIYPKERRAGSGADACDSGHQGLGEREGEFVFNGDRASVGKMTKSWRRMVVMAAQQCECINATEMYT